MWKLRYTYAHKQYLENCALLIIIVSGLFTLEISHLSLKHGLPFNMFSIALVVV